MDLVQRFFRELKATFVKLKELALGRYDLAERCVRS